MMESVFNRIIEFIKINDIKVSLHGYEESAEDRINIRDIITGVNSAAIIEEYSDFPKGPCVLVLQRESNGNPIHVVWGIPAGQASPAVLITAYRPDPKRWADDFLRRKI